MQPTYQSQSSHSTLRLVPATTLVILLAFSDGASAAMTNHVNIIPSSNGPSHSVLHSTTVLQNRRSGGFAAFGAQKTNALNIARLSGQQNHQISVVTDIGPNHRGWTRMDEGVAPAAVNQSRASSNPGKAAATRNTGPQVIELATGMNYWDGNQWSPSDATFELTDDAFVANRVQHRTRLNADLNVIGAVTTTLQDGTTLRSTPIAIALYDPDDGRFAVISTLTNSTGILVESNQVLYPDAFSGGVCASVIYTLQKGSFEQDVVISGRLNPLDYSFPTNAQIQIVTEFYDAPQPEKLRRPIYIEEQETVRRRKVSPDLVDEVLGFSDLVFATGRAYTMPSEADKSGAQAVVAKEFRTIPSEDRTYLIETLNCLSIQKELNSLPECEGSGETAQRIRSGQARDGYAFIPKPASQVLGKTQPRRASPQFALVEKLKRTGVVVDYFVNLGSPLSSAYTFKSDTTYLVSGTVYCNGPVTLEAAVLKYKSGATIRLIYPITCKTASYQPAIFTGLDDESVGESVQGQDLDWTGTINPAGYANPAIWCYWYSLLNLSNVRFCYAQEAVRVEGVSINATISHAQLVDCIRGIVLVSTTSGFSGSGSSGTSISVNNSLFAFVQSTLIRTGNYNSSSPGYASFNHCTVDNAQVLANDIGNDPWLLVTFKNSVLANIGSLGNAYLGYSTYNGFYSSPLFGTLVSRWISTENPFQVSDGGAYYLKADSVFRGKGTTTGLPVTLLPALKTKSTQPPIDFPRFMKITGQLTLFPQIPRYTSGPPDLGYWYDVLDCTVAAMFVEGGTINVQPGTAVGFRQESASEPWWPWWESGIGMNLLKGATLISHGTPVQPNTFTDVQLVQEAAELPVWFSIVTDRLCLNPDAAIFPPDNPQNTPPVLDLRFSNLYVSSDWYQFLAGDYFTWSAAVDLKLQDCNIYGGWLYFGKEGVDVNPATSFIWKNNLFDRVTINVDPDYFEPPYNDPTLYVDLAFEAYNNLFRGGLLRLLPISATAGNWVFKDNLFDKIAFVQNTAQTMDHNYNGYWKRTPGELETGQTDRLSPNGTHDVVLAASPTYQFGPLGRYYLPTYSSGLYNAGSRTAAEAGLYHYTTQPNQIKEGDEGGNVNIGLHYVATVNYASATLKDSDSDGIPDYMENWHGDGDTGASRIHTDYETDWNNPTTDTDPNTSTPIADSLNTKYDNVDLSGSGLTGWVKKALGLQPFSPINPIALTQVSGNNQNVISFEVPINYAAVQNAGVIGLNVDGHNIAVGKVSQAPNGNTRFTWNSSYDTPGQHYLQVEIMSSAAAAEGGELMVADASNEAEIFAADTPPSQPNMGAIVPFYSANMIQLFRNNSMFNDNGASLNALAAEPNATYTIDVYDSSTMTPLAHAAGSATDGIINESWAGTNPDGSQFTGNTVQVVYDVPPANPTTVTLERLTSSAELGNHDGFEFAYFYTPQWSDLKWMFGAPNGNEGPLWQGMKLAVNTLLAPPMWAFGSPNYYVSGFNYYDFQGGNPHGNGSIWGYPGYLSSQTDINSMIADMQSTYGHVKNIYIDGHGSAGWMASSHVPPWLGIRVDLVAGAIGNGNFYNNGGLGAPGNPYRFVFLDGCETAKQDYWAKAFGILPLPSDAAGSSSGPGPQAFVGWVGTTTAWEGGVRYSILGLPGAYNIERSVCQAWSYSQTLADFYANWQSGNYTLAQCIEIGAKADQKDQVPLSMGEKRAFRCKSTQGPYPYQSFDFPSKVAFPTPIRVIGHSGLKRYLYDPNFDGIYP